MAANIKIAGCTTHTIQHLWYLFRVNFLFNQSFNSIGVSRIDDSTIVIVKDNYYESAPYRICKESCKIANNGGGHDHKIREVYLSLIVDSDNGQ